MTHNSVKTLIKAGSIALKTGFGKWKQSAFFRRKNFLGCSVESETDSTSVSRATLAEAEAEADEERLWVLWRWFGDDRWAD